MVESLPPLLQSIVTALVIGLGGALVAFLIYVLLARLTNRYVGGLLALFVVIATLQWILDTADAVGLLVILGTVLTGALTLGMGDLAMDLISGAKLFATRPFRVGDTVSVEGHFGKVLEITLTNTVLRGENGHQVIVRNSEIAAGTIINHSAKAGEIRLEVQVAIPADQDLEKAVTAILQGTQNFAPQTANKVRVVCETVSNARMILKVYAFTTGDQDVDTEKTRLMMATLKALKSNKISL